MKEEYIVSVEYKVAIEKIFVQRASEIRNPLSGQDLLNEAVRMLVDFRGYGNNGTNNR